MSSAPNACARPGGLPLFVGKVTCYAISKRLSEDWSVDDLERATSPESLSMAADDYKQGIAIAKKWARDMIKASKVEKVDAA